MSVDEKVVVVPKPPKSVERTQPHPEHPPMDRIGIINRHMINMGKHHLLRKPKSD